MFKLLRARAIVCAQLPNVNPAHPHHAFRFFSCASIASFKYSAKDRLAWKADATVTATYSSQIRRYTVRFWEEQTLIDTVVVDYNTAALCSVTPVKNGVEDPENYVLATWSPVPTGITGDTDCYAIWDRITITDTWEQIFAAEADGTYSTKYAVGDTAKFVLGESETVVMQIVAMDTDDLADGSGKAKNHLDLKVPASGFQSDERDKHLQRRLGLIAYEVTAEGAGFSGHTRGYPKRDQGRDQDLHHAVPRSTENADGYCRHRMDPLGA